MIRNIKNRMKKMSSYILILGVGFLLFGCMADSYDEMDITGGISDATIEAEAEEFGRQIAGNLRYVVTQMNKNGDDFGDLTKVKTAVAKYASQYTNTSISVEELSGTLRGRHALTPVQYVFLEKINDAQAASRTANEFIQYLKEIIEEIQATVPEIQQRNLLKMTVAMCYLTKEIDLLLKEGLMPVDLKQPQHIRLRSDSNEAEGYWAAIWAGTCIIAGDIVPSVFSILEGMASVAGMALWAAAGCLLLTADTEINKVSVNECIDYYADHCISGPCDDCLHYCRAQGRLDPRCTYN
jgi:hypothetical protein